MDKRYLCSWVYFCRMMYVNIANHYSSLCSITTSQHLGRSQPELGKIEFRAPQRHSAQKVNQLSKRLRDINTLFPDSAVEMRQGKRHTQEI